MVAWDRSCKRTVSGTESVRGHRYTGHGFVYRLAMFHLGLPAREVKPAMKPHPHPLEQPASGHHRIACGEACDVAVGGLRRQGMIWNLSVVGVYLVLPAPPAPGETVVLTFALPGDPAPITCQGRVRWINPPS